MVGLIPPHLTRCPLSPHTAPEHASAWNRSATDAVFRPDPHLPACGQLLLYGTGTAGQADLAAAARRLGMTSGLPGRARIATWGPAGLQTTELAVWAVPIGDALPGLLALPVDDRPSYRRPPDSVRAWALAARLAVRAVAACRVVPDLVQTSDDGLHGVWRASLADSPEEEAVLGWLAAAMPRSGHALAHNDAESAVWDPAALLAAFLDAVADAAVRTASPDPAGTRPRERLLPWTARWAEALTDLHDAGVPLREDPAEVVATIAGWQAAATASTGGEVPELRLRAPDEQDGTWLLDLGLRTAEGVSVPAEQVWAAEDPARQEALLRGLGRCARVFPPIDVALREPTPMRAALDLDQAWAFLSEAAPVLTRSGAVVVLPDHLARDGLRVRLRVDAPEAAVDEVTSDDGAAPGLQRHLAEASWEVALGGEPLSSDELDTLLGAASPLVRWRGRWVQVDEAQLRTVRDRTSGPRGGTLPLAHALALGLAGTAAPEPGDGVVADDVEVVTAGGVALLLDRLAEAAEAPPAPGTPAGFVGQLRPYQRRGVAWLQGMGTLGLGAVLADDMGLGKGIQLIAYLLTRSAGPHLVVCPTSVVGNWERELSRFAPDLAVTRFHGPDRPADLTGVAGVVVTSYGTLRRNADPLTAVGWDVVALDEAQHVKNPTTAGARAARRLRSSQTVALTGTPLENRLSELWALLDVTNPGLLGSRTAFGRRFVAPIEKRRDGRAAARLRRLVAPFVLRREKTDPSVVAELPPKIERTVVCPLTPEQAALYRAVVDRAFGDGQESLSQGSAVSSMSRRGRVLALLTALKQVCNHPAQYRSGGEPAEAPPVENLLGRSGKLATAREIISEAVEAGDQVLVFTQYVAMGRLLVAQLAADLDTDVPFLHGGVSAQGRDRMVAAFQGDGDGQVPPVLVVSLRAGGTGLNLTAATHVVHYDRWWNPAVEDQATDRAHRIGQHRTVEVHKLVTAGTVEERIAEIIERKRALSEHVVGAGEAWITELGDDDLAELVALSPEASIDDLDEDWQALAPAGMEEAS